MYTENQALDAWLIIFGKEGAEIWTFLFSHGIMKMNLEKGRICRMGKYSVLINPRSGKRRSEVMIEQLKELLQGSELKFYNILEMTDYPAFFAGLEEDEEIILAGGDGTMNHFVNDVGDVLPDRKIYFYAMGSGNDFYNDIGKKLGDPPVLVNDYLKNLPQIELNGKWMRFCNGVGFGVDGFVCEEGSRLREKTQKPINYTAVAVKALFFQFKPRAAKVTVDGVTKTYKKVWLLPVMKGRYCGGGMMFTPDQDRLHPNNTISVMVVHSLGKLRLLTIFPQVFKGTHMKYTQYIDLFEGHDVEIEFEEPTSLQVDGEPFGKIKKHRVKAMVSEKEKVTE